MSLAFHFSLLLLFFWTLSSRIACQIVHVVCSFCFATICFALAHRSTFNVHCSLFTFPFPFKHLNLKLWRFSGQRWLQFIKVMAEDLEVEQMFGPVMNPSNKYLLKPLKSPDASEDLRVLGLLIMVH